MGAGNAGKSPFLWTAKTAFITTASAPLPELEIPWSGKKRQKAAKRTRSPREAPLFFGIT